MAKNTIAALKAESKEVALRSALSSTEVALLAELIELYGARGAAKRLAIA